MDITTIWPAKKSNSKNKFALTAAGAAVTAALTLGAAMPASAAPVEDVDGNVAVMAANVSVFANCNADGSYSWTAVGDGYTPNTQYFLLSRSSWTFEGGGGGGQSDWDGHGTATASGGGFVSTSTYYSQALLNRATVTVTVSIGGVEGSTTVDCD